jgi:PhnB protein
MTVSATTHINFNGDARAALTFYHGVFGGKLLIVSYEDAHSSAVAHAPDQVIWGQVLAESGFRIMAYDVQVDRPWNAGENAMYVVVEAPTVEEISGYWRGLADGATTIQPLAPSQWSPLYGMLRDRFGVVWVLSVASD